MDNYLEIGGKYYAMDIDKIVEFITTNCGSVTQEINQKYGLVGSGNEADDQGKFQLVTKEVKETKEGDNSTAMTCRYNIITNTLALILTPTTDVGDEIMNLGDLTGFTIGQRIAFNTLVGMGIIYEIETEDE